MMRKQRSLWFRATNIYTFLLLKALWVFVAMLLSQTLFVCYNQGIFHVDTFAEWMGVLWGNLVFTLVITCSLMLPYALMLLLPIKARKKRGYRLLAEALLIIPTLIALVCNLCDCAYFQFTFRRISSDIFAYLTIGGQMGSLVPHFIVDFWPVTLCGTAIIVLFLLLSAKTRWVPLRKHSLMRNDIIGLVAGMLLLFLGARGGVVHPLRLSDAARYVEIKNSALVTNSPLSLLRTSLSSTTPLPSQDCRVPRYIPLQGSMAQDSMPNIVVVVLESFSQEYMGCYGAKESFTPFLDSLYHLSYSYDGRSNGKKSIEGIPSVFASLPTLMETPIVLGKYRQNDMDGLPKALLDMGYSTAFFHGGYNGTMDFDKTALRMGFQRYFGMDEYVAHHGEEAYDNAWGIFDEPFLQYTAEELSRMREPFMAGIFTLSSHHPYTVAPGYEGKLKEGKHPLLKCVYYSDNALRQFFKACAKEPWFENTVFVITADHPGRGLSREFNNPEGWYRIPLMIYTPHPTRPVGNQHKMMQQIDIMPSLLDYVGYRSSTPICFGQSVFRGLPSWNIVYGNGFYTLVVEDKANPSHHRIASIEGEVQEGEDKDIYQLQSFVESYFNHINK